jgi:hypothetical protein
MANESRKTGFPEFSFDSQSREALQRQLIETPMEAASQSALGTAVELFTFMSGLPDAFAASERRELKRILKSGNDADPRVAALQGSIEQADILQSTARLGQARVERALAALTDRRGDLFHGFVSDTAFTPLEGLTVRLTDTKTAGAKVFAATTGADGYFSMDLGTKQSTPRDSRAKDNPISMSQRIVDLVAGLGQDSSPAATGSAEAEAGVGQVDILKSDKLLHHDPALVVLKGGSVYREYVIADAKPSSAPEAPRKDKSQRR